MVDDKLAGWLHAVELSPGSERQQAIATAATTFAGQPKTGGLPDLVLLAHGIEVDDAFTSLTAAVVEEDDTFGCAIGELETHLIAATFAAAVMERSSMAATTAASLVLTAEAIGLQSPIAELPALAKEARQRRAGVVRKRGQITAGVDVSKAYSEVPPFAEDGTPALHEQVRLLRKASLDGIEATAKSMEALATRLSARLRAADEELDLLWWCFAGRSEVLKAEWTKVGSPGLASIAAAVEMHRLLQFPAEPASATALLAKNLGKHADKEITLATAVNAAGKQGLAVEIADGHQLLPVLSSLAEHKALGGKPAWKESVARWRIDPDRTWSALDLAAECLRELIILDDVS